MYKTDDCPSRAHSFFYGQTVIKGELRVNQFFKDLLEESFINIIP
jgi:hypothetical protein